MKTSSDPLPFASLFQFKCVSWCSFLYQIRHRLFARSPPSTATIHLCSKPASFKARSYKSESPCLCPHPVDGSLKGGNELKPKLQTHNWAALITDSYTVCCLFASILLDAQCGGRFIFVLRSIKLNQKCGFERRAAVERVNSVAASHTVQLCVLHLV